MHRLSRLSTVVLTTAVCTALSVAAGHVAAVWLARTQHDQQLNELAEVALRRAEVAVDFAAGALRNISEGTELSCGSASLLQELRFHVYELGPIKDIRITDSDGAVRCSAFSETLEFDRLWPRRDSMLPSEDGQLQFFRVETFSGSALGVLSDVNADQSLVAILANGTALLDVMPRHLRGHSQVSIELSDGQPVYRLYPGDGVFAAREDGEFSTVSDRYPLRSVIRVEPALLADWNGGLYAPVTILAGLLGLAFGIILSRTFVRPDGPIEELDKAIAKREFVPHLQPVFDLKSNTIVGCEILARWPQPDGTILPPSRFIPLAEASGRIEALTWLLLSQGLAALRPLLRSDKSFCVSVNVAPSHFMSPHFVEDLQAVVRNHSVARRQVVVEITEREPFADLNSAKAAAARLRGAGFRLAIDDVGVGHSGLSHLQSLGANILKIDKFFVDSIDLDPTARSIVEVLVRLARQLGMSVVAEGIESRAQVEALLACGVAQGQGFHLLAPLSVEAFIELTKGHGTPAPARSSAA